MKKWLLNCAIVIKNFFSAEKREGEIPADEQTLLCLEAARLSVDHVVNF